MAELTAESGDLRVGIDLLRRAGLNAEMRASRVVERQDVEEAYDKSKFVHLSRRLQENEALDPLLSLDNVVIRYARTGVTTNSASPAISNALVQHNATGVRAVGASELTITNSDFSGNTDYGLLNEGSFVIDANTGASNVTFVAGGDVTDGNMAAAVATSGEQR